MKIINLIFSLVLLLGFCGLKKKGFLIIVISLYKGKEMSYKGRLRGFMEKG